MRSPDLKISVAHMNEFDDDISTRARDRIVQPRKILWITRGLMVILSGLIGIVILSSPRLTAGMNFPGEAIDAIFSQDVPATPLSTSWDGIPAGEETTRPAARVLPLSRVPVRRGTADPADD